MKIQYKVYKTTALCWAWTPTNKKKDEQNRNI
jgi:hypothetical protein